MTTKEIRDRLMIERVKYQNAVADMEKACKDINQIRDEISEEDVQLLADRGINVRTALSFDVERCKTDKEYLDSCKESLRGVVETLHSYLEGEFNV